MGQEVPESTQARADRIRKRVVAGPQIAPIRGIFAVRGYIEDGVRQFENHRYKPVMEDCLLKLEAGEEKYGSPLESHNGRSADLDAYQDILDAINYQSQAFLEATEHRDIVERSKDIVATCNVAVRIRERLVKQGVLK